MTHAKLKKILIQYYALLRETSGIERESVVTQAKTLTELYHELCLKHKFPLSTKHLKVAVNDKYCNWTDPIKNGDQIVFIPPVAGG